MRLRDLLLRIDAILPQESGAPAETPARDADPELELHVVERILSLPSPRLEPALDARSRNGHCFPLLEREFGLPGERGFELLEELAELGILERSPFNRVHLCPRCRHCQLNFQETCPHCGSIQLSSQRMLHHFRCAHVDLESAFAQDARLICPKCRRPLEQLGLDYDRLLETHVCSACRLNFEEPFLNAQCLHCEERTPAGNLATETIHAFRATPLARRALDLRRLTGLDLGQLLFQAEVGLATREYYTLEFERELLRLEQLQTPFSSVSIAFELSGRPCALFHEWSLDEQRSLAELLRSATRKLDLVAKLAPDRVAILLPGTDRDGCARVEQRLGQVLAARLFLDGSGRELVARVLPTTFTNAGEARAFWNACFASGAEAA